MSPCEYSLSGMISTFLISHGTIGPKGFDLHTGITKGGCPAQPPKKSYFLTALHVPIALVVLGEDEV